MMSYKYDNHNFSKQHIDMNQSQHAQQKNSSKQVSCHHAIISHYKVHVAVIQLAEMWYSLSRAQDQWESELL